MVVFIILHYQNIGETYSCVGSISKAFKGNYKIIIVDNASPNQSGKDLEEKYLTNDDIFVIRNKSNLGYAKGLNVGIHYAKQNYCYNYLILLNNDTEIIGDNWINVIEQLDSKYKFDVLGPDIINLDGNHCNPRRKLKYNIFTVSLLFFKTLIEYVLFILLKINFVEGTNNTSEWGSLGIGVELQGSCLIFSKRFFDKEVGLFPETNFYCEESILKYICDEKKYKTIYSNSIQLLHKEGKATKTMTQSIRENRRFTLTHTLYSRYRFLLLILRNKLLLKDRY